MTTRMLTKKDGALQPNFFLGVEKRIADLKSAGREVIRLDIGSPDLPPAPFIIQALAQAAARPDVHGYQSHRGTAELRAAWTDMYRNLFQVQLDPETQVLPLLGSKEGIFHLSLAWVEPGDIVLVPDPGYMTYTQGARFAGGEVYRLPLLSELGYRPDLQTVPADIARRAKILWLNYPNNPTSATVEAAFFEEAVAFAQTHDILICHDAAYSQVVYDGYRAPSILQAPGAAEVAVEFNTLSKSHNMAGWRLGVALGNHQALAALLRVKSHADSGHFLAVWQAAIAALSGDQTWLKERNLIYQERRDTVVETLRALGLPVESPRAGLYVWTPIPSGWQADGFAANLLEETGVCLTPGTVFGPGGEGYVRISLGAPLERIEKAMERFSCFYFESQRRNR